MALLMMATAVMVMAVEAVAAMVIGPRSDRRVRCLRCWWRRSHDGEDRAKITRDSEDHNGESMAESYTMETAMSQSRTRENTMKERPFLTVS